MFLDFVLQLNSTYGLMKKFHEVTFCRTVDMRKMLIWGNNKHALKTDDDKLFKDLLINKIFSQQILSSNFKMELCLKKGIIWGFLGLILTAFFVKLQFVE